MAKKSRVGRRAFIRIAGVTGAAVGLGGTVPQAVTGLIGTSDKAGKQQAELPEWLRPGAPVHRWVIEAVHPLRLGAIPVLLRTTDGRLFQVDVLRRDTGPAPVLGVGNTRTLSLFVMNRGDGGKPTDEEQGLGAMALAELLAAHEHDAVLPPGLLTIRERAERHPTGNFTV